MVLGPAGPAGPWSGYNTNKTFQVFIDLFTFLSSIRGFPDARKGWKIKLTRTQVNFVPKFLSLYDALDFLDIF